VWKIRWQVFDGPYIGETIEDNINVQRFGNSEKDQTCQRIGQGTVKRICNLMGLPYPIKDTAPMVGGQIGVEIRHEEFVSNRTGKKLKSAKISKYIPLDDVRPAHVAAQPAEAPGNNPPPPTDEDVPW
jgi:hypothetical protein